LPFFGKIILLYKKNRACGAGINNMVRDGHIDEATIQFGPLCLRNKSAPRHVAPHGQPHRLQSHHLVTFIKVYHLRVPLIDCSHIMVPKYQNLGKTLSPEGTRRYLFLDNIDCSFSSLLIFARERKKKKDEKEKSKRNTASGLPRKGLRVQTKGILSGSSRVEEEKTHNLRGAKIVCLFFCFLLGLMRASLSRTPRASTPRTSTWRILFFVVSGCRKDAFRRQVAT
jgi:hypothetical protein